MVQQLSRFKAYLETTNNDYVASSPFQAILGPAVANVLTTADARDGKQYLLSCRKKFIEMREKIYIQNFGCLCDEERTCFS